MACITISIRFHRKTLRSYVFVVHLYAIGDDIRDPEYVFSIITVLK